jgi:probable F420-dependent oxidoreductase
MTSRPLRLGLGLFGLGSVASLTEDARRAEQIGFDVVLLPDHLGFTAPLPPLVAIAQAAPTVRVGNLVLNAPFYRPALLARDLASIDSASNGRLEIGLGAGFAEKEFIEAGIPFPGAGARVDLLTEHVVEIKRLLSNPGHIPPPVQTPPPIMVAGVGDRVLAMAAEHADIVAIQSFGDMNHLAERIDFVKAKAGARLDEIELAFGFFQASIDDPDDLSMLKSLHPEMTDAELRRSATYLGGSIDEAVDRVRSVRDGLGISYFHFGIHPGLSWESLEKLVAALK